MLLIHNLNLVLLEAQCLLPDLLSKIGYLGCKLQELFFTLREVIQEQFVVSFDEFLRIKKWLPSFVFLLESLVLHAIGQIDIILNDGETSQKASIFGS
jgi:hypothetical protein